MNLKNIGVNMFEKYWCEYVILGCPRRPLFYFTSFLIKKGLRPTVYAQKAPLMPRILGLASFCVSNQISRHEVTLDILLRHADCHSSKKCILIYTPDFAEFIQSCRERLEKNFLLLNSEETYEA